MRLELRRVVVGYGLVDHTRYKGKQARPQLDHDVTKQYPV
jgi:hypothetical protein